MKRYYTSGILLILIFTYQSINAQHQLVKSHGLDIGYRIFGKGKPILIIGGGPGDLSDRYLSLCELLSTKYQCVLVDQRGTGVSTPEVMDSTTVTVSLTLDDFEAIRKQLELKEWNVLGFSYGGLMAALYAHHFPQSVSALIHLNSIGLNRTDEAKGAFIDNIYSRLQASDIDIVNYWSDSSRIANNYQHAVTEIIRAWMPGYFYDRQKSLLVSEPMKDADFNFEMGQWIWKDIEKNNLDISKVESKYKGPVLIVQGRQDPLGEAIPLGLKNYYNHSELIFIEKAGHYSWIEQPEDVLNAISNYLK